MNKLLGLVLLCVMTSPWAATKVYKWVDEEGRIHYSGQKPPGLEVETMSVKTGKPTATRTVEPSQPAPEANEAAAADDAAEAVDPEAEAAARAQLAQSDQANSRRLCEEARKNTESLNRSVRVNQRDPNTGEVRRLTDDERVAALANAQRAIQRYCR